MVQRYFVGYWPRPNQGRAAPWVGRGLSPGQFRCIPVVEPDRLSVNGARPLSVQWPLPRRYKYFLMGGWEARKFSLPSSAPASWDSKKAYGKERSPIFLARPPRNSKTRMKGVSTRHGNVSRPALRGLYCDVCVTRVLLLCEEGHVLSPGEF